MSSFISSNDFYSAKLAEGNADASSLVNTIARKFARSRASIAQLPAVRPSRDSTFAKTPTPHPTQGQELRSCCAKKRTSAAFAADRCATRAEQLVTRESSARRRRQRNRHTNRDHSRTQPVGVPTPTAAPCGTASKQCTEHADLSDGASSPSKRARGRRPPPPPHKTTTGALVSMDVC